MCNKSKVYSVKSITFVRGMKSDLREKALMKQNNIREVKKTNMTLKETIEHDGSVENREKE